MDEAINTNIFPAKLWRLVNSPGLGAIGWDSHGELIVVDQQLFQKHVLSRGTDRADGFKTANFSSFVRQLNLYGFRKAEPPAKQQGAGPGGSRHYFYNPNFKRDHPELVARLRRLTAGNKAKLRAGLDVKCRFWSPRHRRSCEGEGRTPRRKSSPLRPAAHPDPSRAPPPQSGTPVPVPVFAPVQHTPYSGGGAPSSAQVQQGSLSRGGSGIPPFTRFNAQNDQYQPPYYPSVCQCCRSNLVQSNVPSLQTEFFSPQRYYQGTEIQEAKKSDLNLDAIFQIADEMMQASSGGQMVKVQTPNDPVNATKPSPAARENSTGTAAANAMPVVVAVSCIHAYTDQESVTLVPKQMPEDAMFEASALQEKDAEIVIVEVSNQVGDMSQK
ncbi:heat shock factor protein 5 [Kryptolebias marmoratus]|uniref:heat shock factor protein 5 n=1 Tax=Kryptolebias marmoratus TaxID=37003 RepID=UPI000D531197|nr:heat shock factor protein 5 [Kryptolebias marmoratus]XP_037834890.1 heat shock factor protein 5 [Kryptolebias marmoratus]XP_037834891.1 heat shock factor protein 5 [Kryptolebias marmoratus]